MQQQQHLLSINSTTQVAFWEIKKQEQSNKKHIFMTHGTFSTRRVLLGIVDYLTQQGYTCWVLEWRNHGDSPATTALFNFEDLAKEEIKAAFDFLIQQKGIKVFDCITHSGGGIILTMALLYFPVYQSHITTITFFACQAFRAAYSITNKIKIQLGKSVSSLLGYIPARLMASEESESHYLMQQWFDWNLSGQFVSQDGKDFQKEMSGITIPIFSISGAGDTFIAPPSGCRAFLEAFANNQNQFLVAGKINNFEEDYTHSRVLHSRAASREIYPLVLNWLQQK